MLRRLEDMRLATQTDENLYARYAAAVADWRACREFIDQQDAGACYMVRDRRGLIVAIREYPQVKRLERLSEQCLKMERQMGLTPSARAGLAGIQTTDQETAKSRFFGTGATA